jgi:ketosteroid isomerase-like protein
MRGHDAPFLLDTWRAMSENLDLVRSIYADWERGDFDSTEWAHPDIEYVNPPGAIEPGTRRGLVAFSRAVESVFEGWDAWQMEAERLEGFGDQVAVVVRYRARGRASGVEVEGRESARWTVRDGKVVRYEWFHEPSDAFQAARLGE